MFGKFLNREWISGLRLRILLSIPYLKLENKVPVRHQL